MTSPDVAEAPADEARLAAVERLSAALGDALVAHELRPGQDLFVRVATDAWFEAGTFARSELGCLYLSFVSAIDWLPSPWGRSEDDDALGVTSPADVSGELAHGVTGGETRFQVMARVASTARPLGLTLKADVPDDTLTIDSWVPVYAGANWHEREAWEMFGITFRGHPDLRHIYLPSGFEGHPLRKDFPLISRLVKPWPGVVDVEPMPGGDDEEGETA